MSQSEAKNGSKIPNDRRLIFLMLFLTIIVVTCIFWVNSSKNINLPVTSVTPAVTNNTATMTTTPVNYSVESKKLEEDYDALVKKVQDNINKATTAHQQSAVSSYYTIEAMELLQKQNSLIIKQNEKIIELLTEIKNKK